MKINWKEGTQKWKKTERKTMKRMSERENASKLPSFSAIIQVN